jgi:hypothetical protein
LLALAGAMFFQVGRRVAEENVRAQFREKIVATEATENEHLAEFFDMWGRSMSRWLATLNTAERTKYEARTTDGEWDAFRILQGFHRFAQEKGEDDFPVVRDNLGARLGMTGEGAGQLRIRFVADGVIGQTRPYVAHKWAARFRWFD